MGPNKFPKSKCHGGLTVSSHGLFRKALRIDANIATLSIKKKLKKRKDKMDGGLLKVSYRTKKT